MISLSKFQTSPAKKKILLIIHTSYITLNFLPFIFFSLANVTCLDDEYKNSFSLVGIKYKNKKSSVVYSIKMIRRKPANYRCTSRGKYAKLKERQKQYGSTK